MATDAFQLKGSLFTLTVLQLHQADMDSLTHQLDRLVQQAPKFFQHTPVVIDLQAVQQVNGAIDFAQLADQLRQRGMIPVGVRNGSTAQQQAAIAAKFAILNATTSKAESHPGDTAVESSVTSMPNKPSLMIHKPIRSGQQVYAQGGDLIVTAPVSQGAELLADGNIHIYAALRGRALAGIQGDSQARIFCQHLAAELVSIAGHYMVNEALQQVSYNKPHQIYLAADKLLISPLG
ncbi:MAG: septum site-determining protein MinC [Legionellales bacterium]|nr:septum site-determining protein MinC [Legionellales bacterium]